MIKSCALLALARVGGRPVSVGRGRLAAGDGALAAGAHAQRTRGRPGGAALAACCAVLPAAACPLRLPCRGLRRWSRRCAARGVPSFRVDLGAAMDGLDEETQLALALSASEADEAERARSARAANSPDRGGASSGGRAAAELAARARSQVEEAAREARRQAERAAEREAFLREQGV